MPRPGSSVIHPGMLDAVRGGAEAAQLSTCRLLEPAAGLGEFDRQTGQHAVAEPTELWAGPCRVQRQSRSEADEVDAAGESLLVVGYQVTVPMSAPLVPAGTLVELVSTTDPQLRTGTRLVVHEAAVGDNQAERNLACELT